MKLDLSALTVESFEPAVNGDPSQWLMRLPPDTADTMDECCPDDLYAPTPPYNSCGCLDG